MATPQDRIDDASKKLKLLSQYRERYEHNMRVYRNAAARTEDSLQATISASSEQVAAEFSSTLYGVQSDVTLAMNQAHAHLRALDEREAELNQEIQRAEEDEEERFKEHNRLQDDES